MTDGNQTYLETVAEEDEEVENGDRFYRGVKRSHTQGGAERVAETRYPLLECRGRSTGPGCPPSDEPNPKMADSMDSGVESDNGKVMSKSNEQVISGRQSNESNEYLSGAKSKETGCLHRPERDRAIRLQDGRVISRKELNEVSRGQNVKPYISLAGFMLALICLSLYVSVCLCLCLCLSVCLSVCLSLSLSLSLSDCV